MARQNYPIGLKIVSSSEKKVYNLAKATFDAELAPRYRGQPAPQGTALFDWVLTRLGTPPSLGTRPPLLPSAPGTPSSLGTRPPLPPSAGAARSLPISSASASATTSYGCW